MEAELCPAPAMKEWKIVLLSTDTIPMLGLKVKSALTTEFYSKAHKGKKKCMMYYIFRILTGVGGVFFGFSFTNIKKITLCGGYCIIISHSTEANTIPLYLLQAIYYHNL